MPTERDRAAEVWFGASRLLESHARTGEIPSPEDVAKAFIVVRDFYRTVATTTKP